LPDLVHATPPPGDFAPFPATPDFSPSFVRELLTVLSTSVDNENFSRLFKSLGENAPLAINSPVEPPRPSPQSLEQKRMENTLAPDGHDYDRRPIWSKKRPLAPLPVWRRRQVCKFFSLVIQASVTPMRKTFEFSRKILGRKKIGKHIAFQ
jgi:hypothetical protein